MGLEDVPGGQDRNVALQGIGQQDGEKGAVPHGAQDVRSAYGAAPVVPHVDPLQELARDVAVGDRPDKVGGQDYDDELPDAHSLLLRNTSRIAVPSNPNRLRMAFSR